MAGDDEAAAALEAAIVADPGDPAPYAVYAGFNRRVRVRGIQPPRRLQPSPLHLILRSLSPAVDQDALAVDTFEFLDMDAY